MKFLLTATSYNCLSSENMDIFKKLGAIFIGYLIKDPEIEINSLEELMDLKRKLGNDLIITEKSGDSYPTIEIYNDYRE